MRENLVFLVLIKPWPSRKSDNLLSFSFFHLTFSSAYIHTLCQFTGEIFDFFLTTTHTLADDDNLQEHMDSRVAIPLYHRKR